jgi:hypothetical protein
MSKYILAICVAGGLYWYFVESRTLSKSNIEGFYVQYDQAVADMDAEKLCDMLTIDYEGVMNYPGGGKATEMREGKTEACDGYDSLKDAQRTLRKVGHGGINSQREIYGFDLSKNKQEATVDMRYSINMGGLVDVTMLGTDILVRKNGKVMIKHSEARPIGRSGA